MNSPEKPGRSPGDAEAARPSEPHRSRSGFSPDPSWVNQNRLARINNRGGRIPIRTPMPSAFTPPVLKGGPPPAPEPVPEPTWPKRLLGAFTRKA